MNGFVSMVMNCIQQFENESHSINGRNKFCLGFSLAYLGLCFMKGHDIHIDIISKKNAILKKAREAPDKRFDTALQRDIESSLSIVNSFLYENKDADYTALNYISVSRKHVPGCFGTVLEGMFSEGF